MNSSIGNALECAVAVIVIKEIGRSAALIHIANEQIVKAVIVVIRPQTSVADAFVGDDGSRSDFGERAIAIVMKEHICAAIVHIAMVGDEQIKKTIVVIIHPGTGAKMAKLVRHHTAADPAEGAVAVAMVKGYGNAGQQFDTARNGQIKIAIVVIIASGGPDMIEVVI